MTIQTTDHSVELREYLTGGQTLELRKMQLQASKVKNFDVNTQSGDIETDLSVTVDIQKKALEFAIISFDGDQTGAMQKVLDLPSADFEKVLSVVDELRGEKKSH